MKGRRQAREWAVQFLFQQDFNDEEIDPALEEFWASLEQVDEEKVFTEELIRGVHTNRTQIDEKIRGYVENWSLERLAAVDRNVLRLALYEIFFRLDIPPVVSINEAVDVAKNLSGSKSGKFVNGILDRAIKDIDRPARSAASSG